MVIAEADLLAMWKKDLEIFEVVRTQASLASPGNTFSNKSIVQLHSDMDALLKGTRKAAVEQTVLVARAAMASVLGKAARSVQNHVLEYGLVIGSPGAEKNDFTTVWADLFRYYAENSKRVTSRGFVFGSPSLSAASVGTGALNRLNTDAWGFTMENQTADAKLARCKRDQISGTGLGEEEFSIESSTAEGRDNLEEAGSGKKSRGLIAALSAATSQKFGLANPSFSTNTPAGATAVPSDIGGWTSEVTLGGVALAVSGTTYEVLGGTGVSGYYRGYEGDTTPLALRCKANDFCLSQNLDSAGAEFALDRAYYVHVAVRRKSSADGTLTLTLGRVSKAVTLSSLSNDTWSFLKIGLTTKDNWAKNFGQENLKLSIARVGGSTGSVDLDDAVIGEFSPFDGGLYAFVGGATAHRIEDKLTWTDAEYNTASTTLSVVAQKWLWRAVGLYLPSCPTAPTQPSAALAGAGAGNVDNGTHRYWTSFTDVNGIESGLSSAIAADVTVADKTVNGKVTVTRGALPTVTTPLSTWNVYRSTTPASNTAKLLTSGIALGTTAYTDNTADASLGATHGGHSVTFADPP